jgi:predicted metal-binding protein
MRINNFENRETSMKKIGIIICGRYKNCGGGKCFRALRERVGGFVGYPKDENVEIVGYSYCGDCPGGNIEYVPEEMKNNGAEAIHLATGLVVGYPPCPRIRHFKEFIECRYEIHVVIGTHPIPLKYMEMHKKLSFWEKMNMEALAGYLMKEDQKIMEAYN